MTENLSLPYRLAVSAITLLVWLVIYFLINRLKIEPQGRIDLGIPLDRKIPFVPLFAPVYFSTYPFVLQPFILLSNPQQFYWMLASFASITFVSSLIHVTLPSKIERVEHVDTGGVSGWMLGLFQKTCKPYGNFPSMHVGLCVPAVAANFMAGGVTAGCITLIWAVLIAFSTLYTKQHYVLDVLAGFAIGIVIFTMTFGLMMT